MFSMRSTPYQIQCGRILCESALLNTSRISKLAEFKTRFETQARYLQIFLFALFQTFRLQWDFVNILIRRISYSYRLCGLVVRILGYRSWGPGSIPGTTRKKKYVVGLERGPLSLVSTTEELLDRKVAAPVYKTETTGVGIRHVDHVAPSIRKRLAITSPTSGGSLADSDNGGFFFF
jgi:hypothetical protein